MASRSIGSIYAELSLNDEDFRKGLSRNEKRIAEFQNTTGKMGRTAFMQRDSGGLSGALDIPQVGSMAAMATGVGAVTAAFLGMNAAMKGILQSYASFDSMNRGMITLEGTVGATTARIEKMRELAKMPGLGFEEAVQGDIRLRSTGLSAEMSEKALKGFANALAAVGGSKDDFSGVIRALGQISAKGKVSAEEINQLAERVPQIRKVMEEAFGTADTEMLASMGIKSTEFISGIINELEKIPKVQGGVQNSLDNYADSWAQLKTQASEFGVAMAGRWLADVSRAMTQARAHMVKIEQFFGVKPPEMVGNGITEEMRMRQKAADDAKAQELDIANATIRAHNQSVEYMMRKDEERIAWNKKQTEEMAKAEEERTKSRNFAQGLYNEESRILSAKLQGNKDLVAQLEREKAIREKIAELVAAGFTPEEAAVPAAAFVDAAKKLQEMQNQPQQTWESSSYSVNDYQSRGLSLDGGTMGRKADQQVTILGQIKDILKAASTNGRLVWD